MSPQERDALVAAMADALWFATTEDDDPDVLPSPECFDTAEVVVDRFAATLAVSGFAVVATPTADDGGRG